MIKNYNNTEHRGINATPNEMEGKVPKSDIEHNKNLLVKVNNTFNIGDTVRYKLEKQTFGKESSNWSKTVYTVVGLDGFKVEIKSKNNHTLYRAPNDLKKVHAEVSDVNVGSNQVWQVESILEHKQLKTGKNKYLVKWLNYDEPTWEPQANLRLIKKNQMSNLEKEYFEKLKSRPM